IADAAPDRAWQVGAMSAIAAATLGVIAWALAPVLREPDDGLEIPASPPPPEPSPAPASAGDDTLTDLPPAADSPPPPEAAPAAQLTTRAHLVDLEEPEVDPPV